MPLIVYSIAQDQPVLPVPFIQTELSGTLSDNKSILSFFTANVQADLELHCLLMTYKSGSMRVEKPKSNLEKYQEKLEVIITAMDIIMQLLKKIKLKINKTESSTQVIIVQNL